MELNWSTFVLEIINFLVLVWILKRFLYRPVLDVIARRQAGIDKTLNDAKTIRSEAEKLQQQYEGRLESWAQEREQARESLATQLDAERTDRMKQLESELSQEREKSRVVEARRQADIERELEMAALSQGARFASRLLEQAAGPELQLRLVEMLLEDLNEVSSDRTGALRTRYGKAPDIIDVTSAFPLSNDQRNRLEKALKKLVGPDVSLRYRQSEALLAGLRIVIGAWVLGANVLDELKGFAELKPYEDDPGHERQSA